MDLFTYFTSLAEKGETALIVKQIDTGKKCLDGSPRYTWPAYLPSHKRREGESWFLNTGSFIIDRFKDGKPSASDVNCTHVLFMMLDDIGTKSKTPPLPPTAIVETSPGNYQYWYAYADQPTVEEHCGALNAIARAGYTDRGATNAVRNCRLPDSVNKKPGRDSFICKEIEFHKGREFTLAQICEALNVTPDPPGTRQEHIRLTDTGKDDVVAWLNENKLVMSRVNSEGWMGVVCPNHAEHTDGQIEGRYMPVNRAFCCLHEHCKDLDSRYFLDWVAGQGGPKHAPGLRDDLITSAMQGITALTPTKEYPDKAAQWASDVEKSQAGRELRSKWHGRFAYVVSDDAYFDRETCTEISRKAFNALFRHIECFAIDSQGKKRRLEASSWFDAYREELKGYALTGLTYAAGEDWMVHKDGLVYGNVWRDARPKVTSGGDPTPWLEHCRRLVPDERELNHIWDVMAYKVQHANIKVNHAILHGGIGGCGKDTMWAPFLWTVCGPHERNKGLIDNDSLSSQWGYQLEAEVVVLNELKEPDMRDRRALANKLKPIIAAPPEMLTINRKGLHPYQMINRLFMLAFTNEDMPITLDSDDRRWFCVWSGSDKMTPEEAGHIWGWYKSGGFEAVAHWLHQRDVSQFAPQAIPPMTEYKQKLIYVGMSNAEGFIYHLIEKNESPFNVDVIAGPWHDVIQKLSNRTEASGFRIVQPALFHALKECGWVDKGLCHSGEYPLKRHCFVKPHMAKWSKSDVRRLLAEVTNEHAESENVVKFDKCSGRTD